MTTRKRWRIVYPASSDITWSTEGQAYSFVNDLRDRWAAGGALISKVTVQIDEGSGWQPYEHVDFAEEAS